MCSLGLLYENGLDGLEKNELEAVKWYKKSAEAGDLKAMFNLAAMYENGKGGLTANREEAIAWYRKASTLGDVKAKSALKRLRASK
jgi:TPR repeat protein